MEKLLKIAEFEKILVANWTKFLDSKMLMLLVLKTISENKSNLKRQPLQDSKQDFTLSLSRFEPCETYFEVWIEFRLRENDSLIIGTTEFHLFLDGKITNQRII